MFVNTHWGFILCVLYLLRTVCLFVSSADARTPPPPPPPSSPLHFSFSQCVCVSVSLSLPHHYTVKVWGSCCLNEHTPHCCVLPSSALPPSRPTPISCDTMHHGPSLCMDCVPTPHTLSPHPPLRPLPVQNSVRTGVSDTLFNALLHVRLQDLASAIPKQKSKYLPFWQMQIPKISLCPVCVSLSRPPCSMCIKRQTQHWL